MPTLDEAIEDLKAGFPRDRLLLDPEQRLAYAQDRWPYALWWTKEERLSRTPLAVLQPLCEEEIARILPWARAHSLAVLFRGGGSGVCGAAIPPKEKNSVIVDMTRMNRILHLDLEEDPPSVTVQSGLLGGELEKALQARGYTTGHSPASLHISTVGGWIATRSCGQLSTRYGNIGATVLELKVIDAEGKTQTLSQVEEWLGSEGTLGGILEARLRIFPWAAPRRFQSWEFKDLPAALSACRALLESGILPLVLRLYDPADRLILGPAQKPGILPEAFHGILLRHPTWMDRALTWGEKKSWLKPLVLTIFEDSERSFLKGSARAEILFKTWGGKLLGPGPARIWWKKRYDLGFEIVEGYFRRGCFTDTLDAWAEWEKLSSLYQTLKARLRSRCLLLAHLAHFTPQGACLYLTLAGSAGSFQKTRELYRELWRMALETCIEGGAKVNHHHNIGLAKQPWIEEAVDPEWKRIYLAKKMERDPSRLFNPDKLFRPPEAGRLR
ncbi:MAG: FAD-binding oxidoreductase [Elusimicrobia bacterium]|nr:FAD-binding oxidoreductase [Elusimicrobiota bacterium]